MSASGSSNDTFEYSRLDNGHMRLLEPIWLAEGGQLDFTITDYSATNAPEYTAISYTWGVDRATEVIRLNGKRFFVRSNLRSCLSSIVQCMRKERPEARPGFRFGSHIWVDAISINQTEKSERDRQVRQMDRIFSQAAYVSVWLGHKSGSAHLDAWQGMSYPAPSLLWRHSAKAIGNLPFWTRYWVIQEVVLARHKVVFCGNNYIHWDVFRAIMLQEIDYSYNAYALLREYGRYTEPRSHHLCRLLERHENAKCKDPRDRIFALLGLLRDYERQWLARAFPMDTMYTMAWRDVIGHTDRLLVDETPQSCGHTRIEHTSIIEKLRAKMMGEYVSLPGDEYYLIGEAPDGLPVTGCFSDSSSIATRSLGNDGSDWDYDDEVFQHPNVAAPWYVRLITVILSTILLFTLVIVSFVLLMAQNTSDWQHLSLGKIPSHGLHRVELLI